MNAYPRNVKTLPDPNEGGGLHGCNSRLAILSHHLQSLNVGDCLASFKTNLVETQFQALIQLVGRQRKTQAVLSCLFAALAVGSRPVLAQQWEVARPQGSQSPINNFKIVPQTTQPAQSIQWKEVPKNKPPTASVNELNWQLTEKQIKQEQLETEQEIQQAEQLPKSPKLAIPTSGPTYANLRALWRDGDWLPQISNTVPVGFGPQGVMATLNYRAIDCTTGAGICTVPANYEAWQDSINKQGDAYFTQAIGFGDALKYVGIIITNTTQGTAYSGSRGQDQFLGGNQTGFHISKAFGQDTAVRIGVENWIRWDWPQADLEKNAYGVFSQRLRLGPQDGGWFRNLYLTAGAGNGALRPLDKQIGSQIAAQKKAGCYTWNYIPPSGKDCSDQVRRNAVRDGGDFGGLEPIGSIGIEVVKGFNLIGEWSGRNLNLGLSVRPFPKIGFVITPMFENILVNSDYGVNVEIPGAPPEALPSNVTTNRARFSIQASIELKFQ
jgi:hypothetical protein